ncbi:YbjN domain-containing protein, partial [Phenylobacterium sp.]|uniref:YbjN domain-containing protein n=1 Tax=Phenylobacterium sp. TaxID=1871053 RepID=UPI00398336F2
CLSMDLAVPQAQRQTAQELIATINPRVWLGHFELWEEGEIIFRHGMALMTNEQPSLAQAAAMIDVAVEGADRFFPAFDFMIRGLKSPQEAIAACMFETVGEA